jgi:iron complex outermembrane receptor protein
VGQKEPNRDDFEAGQGQIPKPEKLNDIELGIERKSNQFNWGATLYYMLYKDQLVPFRQDQRRGCLHAGKYIPDSYRLGIELQAKAYLNNWLKRCRQSNAQQE